MQEIVSLLRKSDYPLYIVVLGFDSPFFHQERRHLESLLASHKVGSVAAGLH